jgi:hypothetical protein
VALAALLLPLAALAHGDEASFEKTVGAYFVDIGYSSPAPAAGEAVAFDFKLTKGGTDAQFDDVWVKVEEGNDVILATGLYNAPFGGPRLSYSFPKAGTYTISTRYETKDGALAEVSFPLTVSADTEAAVPHDNSAWFGVLGLIAGAGAAFAYGRFAKKP